MVLDNQYDKELSGTAQMTDFTIEANAAVMDMMYAKVYTNRIEAVIREISTNAVDACIAAGNEIKFKVELPTLLVKQFTVRDYGTGLTSKQMIDIYSKMGASTKRESNAYNGTFGIGKLAPLAYTSSFTVESFVDGKKSSYMIATDKGIPQVISMGDPVDTDEPNGIKVCVPVKDGDENNFKNTAERVYTYFDVKPEVNMDLHLDLPAFLETDSWLIPSMIEKIILIIRTKDQIFQG